MVPILNHMHPLLTFSSYFPYIHVNIILPSTSRFSCPQLSHACYLCNS